MPPRVVLACETLTYPRGGHLWVFVNWLKGFLDAGCEVVWADFYEAGETPETFAPKRDRLRQRVEQFVQPTEWAFLPKYPEQDTWRPSDTRSEDALDDADVLFNFRYHLPQAWVRRAKRSALVDIDPGIMQTCVTQGFYRVGDVDLPAYDRYLTIGPGVADGTGAPPTLGLDWQLIHPAVALDLWPVTPAAPDAAFNTVSHWSMQGSWMLGWDGAVFDNSKRCGFLPFAELPRRVSAPLELAIYIEPNEDEERQSLLDAGWRIQNSKQLGETPEAYRKYVQDSLGEFNCAKPAYTRAQTGWVSDRTPCYLASGKPCLVQHTGPAPALDRHPECVARFTTLDEAAAGMERLMSDYEGSCQAARAAAEEEFEASMCARRVLELTL